jgi:urease accessory protein
LSVPVSFQLEGRFDIVCAPRPYGATAIVRQSVCAPFHLSKPYWDGRVLLVQCVNTTPGIFAGDRLALRVALERGASVLLTSPSASRIHTMRSGAAVLDQRIGVSAGAWLEVMPELFIPHAGCRYTQTTILDVETGGRLFFVETLAPGRVARGERFAFERVSWTTDLRYGGRLVARERYVLSPTDDSLWSVRRGGVDAYLATAYLVGLKADPVPALDGASAGVVAGASQLADDVWVARLLAPDSPSLRTALRSFRNGMAASGIAELSASARKL